MRRMPFRGRGFLLNYFQYQFVAHFSQKWGEMGIATTVQAQKNPFDYVGFFMRYQHHRIGRACTTFCALFSDRATIGLAVSVSVRRTV